MKKDKHSKINYAKQKKKHPIRRRICLGILAGFAVIIGIFMHFGGFGTGSSVSPDEIKRYSKSVEDLNIPEGTKVIGLGEATHGNAEFQQLKLDVLKVLVEKYGVRSFVIEGDFGAGEMINHYIHGAEGTAQDAVATMDFTIYRTDEMANLVTYMRQYNETAEDGEDLRFYGMDMHRYQYSYELLLDGCRQLEIDTAELEKLMVDDAWNPSYDYTQSSQVLNDIKNSIANQSKSIVESNESAKTMQLAEVLLQYITLEQQGNSTDAITTRNQMMADNVLWIREQEAALGHECILISGHCSHIGKWDYDTGGFLAEALNDGYYAIGTEFYKARVNIVSTVFKGMRVKETFYSRDPIAKGVKEAGLDICLIDFKDVSADSELYGYVNGYLYMGNLGEGYNPLMRLLPPSYRSFTCPANIFDGVIYVSNAHPTNPK